MDMTPFIVKRSEGEYSTAVVSDGTIIETMWFGNDGSQVMVGREYISKPAIAEKHIHAFESKKLNSI